MKISIITVCYNEAATIEKTLQSIFSQTYQDIESVIIDGGSTDGTLDIIEKYRDRIAYFVSEPDDGVYNAMNKGIKASTGDVLYFLNANDTLYSDDVLEKVVEAFSRKNYDFVYGDIVEIFPEKTVPLKFNKGRNFHALLSVQICHQACFYRKFLFEKFGMYDENFLICSDHDLNMRILLNRKIKTGYINKTIANFERTGISSSKKFSRILENENRLIFYRYAYNSPVSAIIYYTKLVCIEPGFLLKINKLFKFLKFRKKLR